MLSTSVPSQATSDLSGVSQFSQIDRNQISYTLTLQHPVDIECEPFGSGFIGNNCTLKYSAKQTSSNSSSSGIGGLFELRLFDLSNNQIDSENAFARSTVSLKDQSFDFRFKLQNSTQIRIGINPNTRYPSTVISQTPIRVTVITNAEKDRRANEARATKEAFEKSEMAKKLLTIQCTNKKSTKQVKGEKPRCPKGWKNPIQNYPTFKAFSSCKLFKKDYRFSSASLEDRGSTLILGAGGKYPSVFNAVAIKDLACTLAMTSAPSFVVSQIDSTRALDGMQKAKWGSIEAFWTYHPDDGLDISFNYKGK